MLGFSRIGDETICPRVNAAAVLMHIDLAHADAMIARHAGFREPGEKSLYPISCLRKSNRRCSPTAAETLVTTQHQGMRQ